MRVLVEYGNGLGNWIMMTPMLAALRSIGADSINVVVARDEKHAARWDGIAALIRCYSGEGGLIDQVLEADRTAAYPTAGYDTIAVPFHGEPSPLRDSLLASSLCVTSRTPDWVTTHEVEHYLEIPRRLGYRGAGPALIPPGPIDATGRPECIAIGIGSLGDPVFGRKKWTVAKWRETVRLLHLWTGLPIVIVGGPGEAAEADEIRAGRPWCEAITSGDHRESATALAAARFLVTVDTYAMHLGAAVGLPIVALFGPSLVSKNGPWTAAPVEIVRSGYCRDGKRAPCQGTNDWHSCRDAVCIDRLEVGDVMAGVRRLERRIARDPVLLDAPDKARREAQEPVAEEAA